MEHDKEPQLMRIGRGIVAVSASYEFVSHGIRVHVSMETHGFRPAANSLVETFEVFEDVNMISPAEVLKWIKEA